MPRAAARLTFPRWAPEAVALLGLAAYLVQAWVYIHTNIPGLDEGAYLYKGLLFASGTHQPFGPGILTNKAPLAFLIPGYLQVAVGAGLRTGRLFALVAGLLAVLGTYATSRQVAGRWLAAAAVWAFAASPMIIKIYSGAVTEAPIAAMLAWTLFLTVGSARRQWQLGLGAAMSAIMILTRQNMAPVLPLVLLYVLWQHGVQALWKAVLAGGVVLVVGHAVFWPGILQMWAPWLPRDLTPFLDIYRLPANVQPSWNPATDLFGRIGAFFDGLRQHLPIVSGVLAALVLMRKRSEWRHHADFRKFVFVAAVYIGLFVLHAWGAVASSYEFFSCVYCFTPYLGFFAPAGVILAVLGLRNGCPRGSALRGLFACGLLILVMTGIGFSAFEDFGAGLMGLPFPRLRAGGLQPGVTTVGELLLNNSALTVALARRLVSAMAGLLFGCLVIAVAWFAGRRIRGAPGGFPALVMTSLLAAAIGLTPLLAGRAARPDCETDVIALNEEVGYHLSGIIPEGSLIYWDGGLSVVPMLYLSESHMFPPQINSGYTFVQGGDSEELLSFGYWNEELHERWLAEADFVIVEEQRYADWKPRLTSDKYAEYPRAPVGTSCLDGTRLRIFRTLDRGVSHAQGFAVSSNAYRS